MIQTQLAPRMVGIGNTTQARYQRLPKVFNNAVDQCDTFNRMRFAAHPNDKLSYAEYGQLMRKVDLWFQGGFIFDDLSRREILALEEIVPQILANNAVIQKNPNLAGQVYMLDTILVSKGITEGRFPLRNFSEQGLNTLEDDIDAILNDPKNQHLFIGYEPQKSLNGAYSIIMAARLSSSILKGDVPLSSLPKELVENLKRITKQVTQNPDFVTTNPDLVPHFSKLALYLDSIEKANTIQNGGFVFLLSIIGKSQVPVLAKHIQQILSDRPFITANPSEETILRIAFQQLNNVQPPKLTGQLPLGRLPKEISEALTVMFEDVILKEDPLFKDFANGNLRTVTQVQKEQMLKALNKAYRRLAPKYHTDLPDNKAKEEKIKSINDARRDIKDYIDNKLPIKLG